VSKRTASWIVWSMWTLSLALTALSLLLLYFNRSYPDVPVYTYWVVDTLVAIGLSTVGAVIVPRCPPNNPIGWLFCAIGLLFAVGHFCIEYGIYSLLATSAPLPAGEAAAWIRRWIWVPYLGLGVFLFLLFPDSRLPGSGWRWFAWLSVPLEVVATIVLAFSPGPLGSIPIQNPLGVESLPSYVIVGDKVETLAFAFLFVAASSMFVRLRRARGVERQQIKWVAYAAMAAASGAILTYTLPEDLGALWLEWPGFLLLIGGVLGIPVSMGIAITRYRLYEIDLIINRTLVYGALTAILVLFYFGSVTALQSLFSLLTGQGNTLAIVASTLAIAALFNPLRRRIQGVIDRRFYRRKYDARKTLEAFGSRLREQTDLEKLCEDLTEVVDETMQPSHISLWLRFPSSSKEQDQQDQQTTRHKV
jgi:hypothetical protein